MAAKAKRKSGPGGKAPRDAVEAALELAAQQGWRQTTLADIATAAGLTLAELHRQYPARSAILAELSRRADAAMLAAAGGEDESVRDRLFAVLMARFDLLRPYREGLRRIVRDSALDPCAVLAGGVSLGRSLGWALELAGVSAEGPLGLLRRKGLGLVYADAARVWLTDDSEDMGKTMARLDRGLGRAETLVSRFHRASKAAESSP